MHRRVEYPPLLFDGQEDAAILGEDGVLKHTLSDEPSTTEVKPGSGQQELLDATGTKDQQAAQTQSPVTPCVEADSLCALSAVRDGEVAALCVRQLRVCESQAGPANRAGKRVVTGNTQGGASCVLPSM
jgi:hypothetical protein